MKMGKLTKIVPLLLAFAVLVPIGAMAADNPGVYSGQDYTWLVGSSVTWQNYIYQYLPSVQQGAQFEWYNEFHNDNGGTIVEHPVLSASCYQGGGSDTYNLPDLGPHSYTSNFLYRTNNLKALYSSGYTYTLKITHQYNDDNHPNGPSATNPYQTYTGV